MIRFAFLGAVALVLQACPPSPAPPPPDATIDAAPPLLDAAPHESDCAAACGVMAVVCQAPQPSTCASTLANVERDRLIRTPSGASLTCACVRAATSKPALTACGAPCP